MEDKNKPEHESTENAVESATKKLKLAQENLKKLRELREAQEKKNNQGGTP